MSAPRHTPEVFEEQVGTFSEIRERELGPTYVGVKVEVYSFGRWYPGEVVKLRQRTALVRYTTGSGCTRDKAFPESRVRLPGAVPRFTPAVRAKKTTVGWVLSDGHFETELLPGVCRLCGSMGTIAALPPPLLAKETDGTTHVCVPALGGCNHGFAKLGGES